MTVKTVDPDIPQARRRKLYMVCKNELGLTDAERLELACYLLRRDISSFKDLDDAQVLRLLDAAEGYQLIDQLYAQRPPSVP